MWFEELTGFREESPEHVVSRLKIDGNKLKSLANQKTWVWGELDTPSLAELRQRVQAQAQPIDSTKRDLSSVAEHPQQDQREDRASRRMSVKEIVADVTDLHMDSKNEGALFQVASQFNLLEMTSQSVTPEHGIDRYEWDHTQGPKCAIACGAGTIYRNYFVPINGQVGQSAINQIDCLAGVGAALGNDDGHLWRMQNGYCLPSEIGLHEISKRLESSDESALDSIRKLLRIGLHYETEVTLSGAGHTVSQAYCSALPVSYAGGPDNLWVDFATLILEAAYEATICTAILNAGKTQNNTVFLTYLGGGAFGNETGWILKAMRRALKSYAEYDLDVNIVSYGARKPELNELLSEFA